MMSSIAVIIPALNEAGNIRQLVKEILITERPGRLRIFRDGKLDPEPIAGVPEVRRTVLGGLLDDLLDRPQGLGTLDRREGNRGAHTRSRFRGR